MLRARDFDHAGRVAEPDGEGFAGGSACGDRVRITLALDADGNIAAARFGAAACAHATAAAAWACRRSRGSRSWTLRERRWRIARRAGAERRAHANAPGLRSTRCTRRWVTRPSGRSRCQQARRGSPWRCRAAWIPRSRCCASARAAATWSASRCGSGSTSRRPMPSARAARPRPCCARERAVTRSGSRTSRWTAARPFAGPSSSRSWPAMPAARPQSVHDLQRLLPAGGPGRRSGAARGAARGDGPLRAARRARRPHAGRARRRRGQGSVLHARARAHRACSRACGCRWATPRKAAVRAEAAAAGMAAATARESQDVCFLGGGALDDFLAREGVQLGTGSIRDEDGHELGRHAGAAAYTPGQRRGLGVSAADAALRPALGCRAQRARRGPQQPPRLQPGRSARSGGRGRGRRACTPSCAGTRPRSPHGRAGARAACASGSTSPSTASPRGRRRRSTTTPDAWSDRASSRPPQAPLNHS